MSTLGTGHFRLTRQGRWSRVAGISAGAAILLASWAPGLMLSLRGTEPASSPAAEASEPGMPAAPERALSVFATTGGLELQLVSPATLAVAFHEAAREGAVALTPRGGCAVCRNRAKFTPPPPSGRDPSYIVMDSRGRSAPATSAVDVVLPRRTPVLAPVTGTVRNVKGYRLYRRYPDIRVAIAPDADPRRRVVVIHLRGVTLQRGDRVVASTTVIGRVRSFPFRSQVDRYVRGSSPHVHIEVRHGIEARSPAS
jgi:hypothetical protein